MISKVPDPYENLTTAVVGKDFNIQYFFPSHLQPFSEETLVEINDTARVIKHYGRINIFLKFRTHKPLNEYARDIGYTLLTTRWRWILLTVGIVNLVTYIFFSFLWMW